jgi:hypothetical protein
VRASPLNGKGKLGRIKILLPSGEKLGFIQMAKMTDEYGRLGAIILNARFSQSGAYLIIGHTVLLIECKSIIAVFCGFEKGKSKIRSILFQII